MGRGNNRWPHRKRELSKTKLKGDDDQPVVAKRIMPTNQLHPGIATEAERDPRVCPSRKVEPGRGELVDIQGASSDPVLGGGDVDSRTSDAGSSGGAPNTHTSKITSVVPSGVVSSGPYRGQRWSDPRPIRWAGWVNVILEDGGGYFAIREVRKRDL